MGYISKVKIPSETEAYDIFADKSLKDGDGNVISATYFKTADAPKIGTADVDNQLKKIEYTEESAIPPTPNVGTEYACTDFIGYNDLDSNLQSKIDAAITTDSLKPGNGIVIDKNATSDGVEVKVDPAKKYLSIDDISAGLPYKNTATNEWYAVSYTSEATPNRIMQRDGNGNCSVNRINLSTPTAINQGARIMEVGEVVSITAAAGVTSGTLTATQLQSINRYICTLNGGYNNNAWILFNKERYYPMSYEHQTDYYVYANVEYENKDFTVKAITITLKTGAWMLNTLTTGPKLYKHVITPVGLGFSLIDYSAIPTPYTSDEMSKTYDQVRGYYNSNGAIGPIVSDVSVEYDPSLPGMGFTFQYLAINAGNYSEEEGYELLSLSDITDTVYAL